MARNEGPARTPHHSTPNGDAARTRAAAAVTPPSPSPSALIGNTSVVETVFSWPDSARMLVDGGGKNSDYPLGGRALS